MNINYEIGDDVLVKGTIDRISVSKNGIEYFVKVVSGPGHSITDVRTKDIYGKVIGGNNGKKTE